MFNGLYAYIKNIAVLMLLSVFIEMILPNDKIKKYVSLVTGIIMLFTIAGNISNIFDNGNKISVPIHETNEIKPVENVREKLSEILYEEINVEYTDIQTE